MWKFDLGYNLLKFSGKTAIEQGSSLEPTFWLPSNVKWKEWDLLDHTIECVLNEIGRILGDFDGQIFSQNIFGRQIGEFST